MNPRKNGQIVINREKETLTRVYTMISYIVRMYLEKRTMISRVMASDCVGILLKRCDIGYPPCESREASTLRNIQRNNLSTKGGEMGWKKETRARERREDREQERKKTEGKETQQKTKEKKRTEQAHCAF